MVFARSQIADSDFWDGIVNQFDVLADLGEKCLIPSFKIAQLAPSLPWPGRGDAPAGGIYVRAYSVVRQRFATPPSRSRPHGGGYGLVRRPQLWFLDSADTSRAGIITIATIPVLKGLADKLKWELKQSQFRVAEWPVGDRLETHWNEFLGRVLMKCLRSAGRWKQRLIERALLSGSKGIGPVT